MLSAERLLAGTVVREPLGVGPGYWAGAPGAFYDAHEKRFYLTYRLRRPRGVHPDRGGEVRIAQSEDGLRFRDIGVITKDAFGTPSMERSALVRGGDGLWRLFLSFVDPDDARWRVVMLAASDVAELPKAHPRPVFAAADCGTEGVKDPVVLRTDTGHVMLLSVATPTPQTGVTSHATADIYNTGDCRSETGLAVSTDLDHWTWQGVVLRTPSTGWDRYCRRITGTWRARGKWMAFYDGIAGAPQNYEERAGLAESDDLRQWRCLTPDAPLVAGLPGSGSVRYVDVLRADGHTFLYYELCRADGAHELRALRCTLADLSLP